MTPEDMSDSSGEGAEAKELRTESDNEGPDLLRKLRRRGDVGKGMTLLENISKMALNDKFDSDFICIPISKNSRAETI